MVASSAIMQSPADILGGFGCLHCSVYGTNTRKEAYKLFLINSN